jgi:hypothetical protein
LHENTASFTRLPLPVCTHNHTHLKDLGTGLVRMRWLRRVRGNNSSGYDGITEPRDRSLSHGSAPPRFSVVLLCMALFLNSAMASWDYSPDSFRPHFPDNGASPFKYPSEYDSDYCASSDSTVEVEQQPAPVVGNEATVETDQMIVEDDQMIVEK